MNDDMLKKRLKLLINLGIAVLLLIIIYLVDLIFGTFISRFFQAFTSILLPFSIALFISYLIAPVFKLLENKIKQRNRMLNTGIVFAIITVILVFFMRFAGTLIYQQGVLFIENDWPIIVESVEGFLENNPVLHDLYQTIADMFDLGSIGNNINIVGVFQSITSIVITIVLVPVFLFFILNDRVRIYESLIALFPKKIRKHAIELSKRAHHVVEEYFNGRFVTMFVMAIAFTISFFILGFRERSLLFGFMMGFFDVVPYVGPFIAMVLPVVYSLTDETLLFGPYAPLAVVVVVSVGQLIQNNVAQPLIMGKETKLHPLLVLSSFVFFGYLFGIVGIILAIPITGMIRTSLHYAKELHEDRIKLDEEEKTQIREDEEHEVRN